MSNAKKTSRAPEPQKQPKDIQIEPLSDQELDSVAGGCLWANSCSNDSCTTDVA